MLDAQILELHKQGTAPEQIAEALNCSLPAVQYVIRRESKEDLSNDDCLEMANIIKTIARGAENERNRLTAAMFAIEVGRGIKKNKSDLPFVNAVQINQLILNAHKDVLNFVTRGPAQEDPGNSGTGEEVPTKGAEDRPDPSPPT